MPFDFAGATLRTGPADVPGEPTPACGHPLRHAQDRPCGRTWGTHPGLRPPPSTRSGQALRTYLGNPPRPAATPFDTLRTGPADVPGEPTPACGHPLRHAQDRPPRRGWALIDIYLITDNIRGQKGEQQ